MVNDFSTWYIRRSRNRVGIDADTLDRNTSLAVMHRVLLTLSKLAAPMIPFIAEEMFKNLTGEESVHLQDYPQADNSILDVQLIEDMVVVRKIAEITHAERKEANIKLRQPLAKLTYKQSKKMSGGLEKILMEEVNVKIIEYQKSSSSEPTIILDTNITPLLKEEGEARDLIRQIQQIRKEQNMTLADKTKVEAPSWPEKFEELILASTASASIARGEVLKVQRIEDENRKRA